jgi:hypothetical protein
MGNVTDIGELLGKALHEKRARVLWAIGTAAFTVFSTTATVSWKMRGYVDELEHENDKLRGEIRAIAKRAETVEALAEKASKEALIAQQDARDARGKADTALLVAQLTQGKKP